MSRRYEIPERVNLVGGFPAMLTVTEEAEWDAFVKATPELIELRNVIADRNCAAAALSGGALDREGEYRTLGERWVELQDALYAIGAKWYAELKKRDEDEAAKERAEYEAALKKE